MHVHVYIRNPPSHMYPCLVACLLQMPRDIGMALVRLVFSMMYGSWKFEMKSGNVESSRTLRHTAEQSGKRESG